MDATRRWLESFVEWALAAIFTAALLGMGSVVLGEIRTVNAVTPVIAREPTQMPPAPAGVPSRAVSVPILFLEGGNPLRIGDSVAAITSRLGRQAEIRAPMTDHAPTGERLTRFYDYGGTRFSLVFEAVGTSEDMRLAAIYLQ